MERLCSRSVEPGQIDYIFRVQIPQLQYCVLLYLFGLEAGLEGARLLNAGPVQESVAFEVKGMV